MDYEKSLEETAILGNEVLKEYLKSRTNSKKLDMDRVRFGCQSIGAYQKYLGSKGANNTLQFMVLRSISKDREELKTLISGNMPKQLK